MLWNVIVVLLLPHSKPQHMVLNRVVARGRHRPPYGPPTTSNAGLYRLMGLVASLGMLDLPLDPALIEPSARLTGLYNVNGE